MDQKKHLRINSAICDISAANESTLSAYESIVIHSALILTSQKTQAMIAKYRVFLNTTSLLEKPEGAQVKVINGKYEIMGSDVQQQPIALLVNGLLEIGRDAEKALEQYLLIQVNGSVVYPDSLAGKLTMIKVNGSTECYPADAVRLKSTFIVDRTFKLRAKAGQFYAKRRVVLLDEASEPAALCSKGVQFCTRTAVLAESLAEKALPMFSPDAEIHIVPDGCAFVDDDVTLNEALIKRWGSKLYIAGDLVLDAQSASLLGTLEYLKVLGSVQLPVNLVSDFSAIRAEYEQLVPIKGMVVQGKVSFTLDKGMLERHPEGITVMDCVNVRLDEAILPEWIEEKLVFKECVNVACAPHQRSAVELVGPNMADISQADDGDKDLLLIGPDTQVINTSEFRLL